MARRKTEDQELKPYVGKWHSCYPVQIRVLCPTHGNVVGIYSAQAADIPKLNEAILNAHRVE